MTFAGAQQADELATGSNAGGRGLLNVSQQSLRHSGPKGGQAGGITGLRRESSSKCHRTAWHLQAPQSTCLALSQLPSPHSPEKQGQAAPQPLQAGPQLLRRRGWPLLPRPHGSYSGCPGLCSLNRGSAPAELSDPPEAGPHGVIR